MNNNNNNNTNIIITVELTSFDVRYEKTAHSLHLPYLRGSMKDDNVVRLLVDGHAADLAECGLFVVVPLFNVGVFCDLTHKNETKHN